MEKAHVTRSTDEIDAVLALQSAEPGTARSLTDAEQAIAEAILDAEDGYIVTTDEGGDPVWYLSDAETPDLADCTMHTCWPAGQTWPRNGTDEPTEPAAKAIAQAAEDYPLRHEDVPDPDDAADLAVVEVLDDPAGWPRLVPEHWQAAAWVECYHAAYAAEWRLAQNA
jgi:hypothetical protein